MIMQRRSSSSKRSKIFLTHHNAAVKDTADNGCSCAGRLGQRHSPGVQGRIAVVVGEVEARHLEAAVVLLRPVVLVSSISRVYQVANLTAVGASAFAVSCVALQCFVVSRFGEARRLEMVDV